MEPDSNLGFPGTYVHLPGTYVCHNLGNLKKALETTLRVSQSRKSFCLG
ncbi:hypothetical protein CHS0354_004239 [Potamilus streckersoni]|uniref:Uncharacterized protein n=1 Tax=Potamilus streckersoni TaxID=2493646 RepID=A0AAE0SY28_9BIVA|nr:hypothetical protein CHS0354_004239 [Potamilus streckersoni]